MSVTGQKWLLDTNVLLAALIKPEAPPTDTQTLLQNPATTVHFSAASLWEIAIKHSLGRDDFDFLPDDIHQLALQTGFTELPIASSHSYAIARMAWHTALRSTACWSRKRNPAGGPISGADGNKLLSPWIDRLEYVNSRPPPFSACCESLPAQTRCA